VTFNKSGELTTFLGKEAMDASWKIADDLADLRGHRAYSVLLDILGGEIRMRLKVVLEPRATEEEVHQARQAALALQDALGFLEGIGSRKDLQEAQDVVMKGFTDDAEIAALSAQHAESGIY